VAHEYTFAQRVKISLIHGIVETAIRLLGCTLRFETSIEEGGPEFPADDPRVPLVVSCFWHQCVFSAAWHYRNKGFAIMTSRSFDGEWIALHHRRPGLSSCARIQFTRWRACAAGHA